MSLAYLTASFPYGSGESFIASEINFHLKRDNKFYLIPLWARGNLRDIEICTNKKMILLERRLFSFKMIYYFIYFVFSKPMAFISILKLVFKSKFSHILKNLIIIPKAVYISNMILEYKISHLHVHWGSTTATAGLIASKISGVKWSFTCHRWDIYENNLLKLKSESAEFVRFISEKGKNDAINLGVLEKKAKTIHMGVDIPSKIKFENYDFVGDTFNIICPANLIVIKGHFYLIEAVKYLIKKHYNIKLFIAGEGYLREQLNKQVIKNKLEGIVVFLGQLSHEELLNYYTDKKIHCVVLPSLDLGNGLHEGIPVSLMEGMAYGKLVISTKKGSVSELLPDTLNLTTDDKDYFKLANLLSFYIENPLIYKQKCIELHTLIRNEWSISNSMNNFTKALVEY